MRGVSVSSPTHSVTARTRATLFSGSRATREFISSSSPRDHRQHPVVQTHSTFKHRVDFPCDITREPGDDDSMLCFGKRTRLKGLTRHLLTYHSCSWRLFSRWQGRDVWGRGVALAPAPPHHSELLPQRSSTCTAAHPGPSAALSMDSVTRRY